MLTADQIEQFYKDVESLGLRFPGAAIRKATGFSKGNVSEYLGKKKPPSEAFLKAFYKEFSKSIKNVPREADLSEVLKEMHLWRAEVDAAIAVIKSEIVPLLAKATGKSVASVDGQMTKDIEEAIVRRMEQIKKKR